MKNIDISIIIPAYNEASRLPKFLTQIISYCQRSLKDYEIIVVDDGSDDETSHVAKKACADHLPCHILRLDNNCGKGYAVKQGLYKARGHIAVFLDADGSTQVNEIERNFKFFDQGYDVVVGSRVLTADDCVIKARRHRKMMGMIFNFCVRTILFKDIKDTQCGFKMFKKEVIRPVFSKMTIDRFGFDIELLYLAFRLGYKIKEVPISWKHVHGSKVSLLLDPIKMFLDIVYIRLKHRHLKK